MLNFPSIRDRILDHPRGWMEVSVRDRHQAKSLSDLMFLKSDRINRRSMQKLFAKYIKNLQNNIIDKPDSSWMRRKT